MMEIRESLQKIITEFHKAEAQGTMGESISAVLPIEDALEVIDRMNPWMFDEFIEDGFDIENDEYLIVTVNKDTEFSFFVAESYSFKEDGEMTIKTNECTTVIMYETCYELKQDEIEDYYDYDKLILV